MPGALRELLVSEGAARELGERGRAVFAEQAGATGRTVEALLEVMGAGSGRRSG